MASTRQCAPGEAVTSIQVVKDDWERFDDIAKARGKTRGRLLREHISREVRAHERRTSAEAVAA